MERDIYKPSIAQDKDQDVPEFGRFAPHELRLPETRRLSPDLFGAEALQGLKQSAVRRALYFGYGIGYMPPVHFPNAEHFQHVPFANNHWLRYGNMESEHSRVRFMLERYKSRQFPEAFDGICRDVLASNNLLQKWSDQIPRVDKASAAIYELVAKQMEASKVHDDLGYSNGQQGAYQSEPVFYEVSEQSEALERRLWEGALNQISDELRQGDFGNLPSFLLLYNCIKDPITPIRSGLPEQVRLFRELYKESQQHFQLNVNPNNERQEALIAQLALESSFLALPGVKDIACVVYKGHHELPYLYADVARLPRGEFADPQGVVDVIFGNERKKIEGILKDSEKIGGGKARITPITVSYFQGPYDGKPELFIIDGNNRSTAFLLMKYLNYVDFNAERVRNFGPSLREFINLYNLDIKWERDLVGLLQSLPQQQLELLISNKSIIRQFENAKIPALLVQEPNFHTINVKRSKGRKPEIFLLQPMHQVIYNQKRWSLAIPAKQQSHGRAAGNDIRVSLEL